jgi:hypothetical protein
MWVKKYMLFNFLNKKIIDVQAEDEIAMGCCCQPCPEPGPSDCSNTVTFTVTTVVRGVVPEDGTMRISIEDTCLNCIKDKCNVEVLVENPCGGPRIPCTACLTRYRYVGCIKYNANFPLTNGTTFTCFRDCLCIDSVRCYACEECSINRCPTTQEGFITNIRAVITNSDPVPGAPDFSIVTFTITIRLTKPCEA